MFLFAIIFSIIIKNPGGDDEEDDDEEDCKIAPKEDEMLHQQDEGRLETILQGYLMQPG